MRESPSVAISDGGASAAAWARQQGSSFLVQASVNLNGAWTRGVNLAGGFEPAVAIDNSGVATTIWSGGNVVQSSTLLANGSWSPPLAISAVGTLVRIQTSWWMLRVMSPPFGFAMILTAQLEWKRQLVPLVAIGAHPCS
jgi:hypothetical protein